MIDSIQNTYQNDRYKNRYVLPTNRNLEQCSKNKSNNAFEKSIAEYEKLSTEERAKIDKEEQILLLEELKTCGWTIEEQGEDFFRNVVIMFPPYDAPGSVKRAWRQMEANASPELKHEMRDFVFFKRNFLEEQTNFESTMTNDTDGYMNMISTMRNYAEQYNNPDDKQAQTQYKSYSQILDLFEEELKKFL